MEVDFCPALLTTLGSDPTVCLQDGDKKARDTFVAENLGLVHAIVRRFEKRGHDREELFQIGCIGLMMAMDANSEVESLYQPVAGTDGDELLLIDQLGSRGEGSGQQEDTVLNRLLVEQLLEGLNGQERAIIKLRYYENRTQCETAKLLSMTQVQVSRKERKILGKLRGRLR